jgi:DNA-binding PadR family transcriptional regulator
MIPDLTTRQFFVLSLLLDRELEGRALRSSMAQHGASTGRPAFYRLMSRLEDDKFVEGWYEQREVDGDTVRIRKYRITSAGVRAAEAMRAFVAETTAPRIAAQGA